MGSQSERCQTILIVEDDPGIREALQLALQLEGYNVITAQDGKEGLTRLAQITVPCLILLDLMMPVMDGWAFADALRSNMILAAIPIVVVTAFAGKTTPPKDVREIMKKPVDMDALLKIVRQYCT